MDDDFKKQIDQVSFFLENYNTVKKIVITPMQEKQYLGDKGSKICRFCGRTIPDVRFEDDAHAIPQFLGNNRLFSYHECDVCNHEFGEKIEDDFSKFLGFYRTVSQMPGKNKVPSFKSKDTRIDVTNKIFLQTSIKGKIDPVAGEITISEPTDSFTPLGVVKCLVKMALTLMPDSEIEYFEDTIKWVKEKEYIPRGSFNICEGFASGLPLQDIFNYILLRKEGALNTNIPYAIYVVQFSNYVYQTYLPFCKRDQDIQGNLLMNVFPLKNKFGGEYVYKIFEMGNMQKVKVEREMSLTGEFVKELDKEEAMNILKENNIKPLFPKN